MVTLSVPNMERHTQVSSPDPSELGLANFSVDFRPSGISVALTGVCSSCHSTGSVEVLNRTQTSHLNHWPRPLLIHLSYFLREQNIKLPLCWHSSASIFGDIKTDSTCRCQSTKRDLTTSIINCGFLIVCGTGNSTEGGNQIFKWNEGIC